MKNPKSEIRNPKEIRSPKPESRAGESANRSNRAFFSFSIGWFNLLCLLAALTSGSTTAQENRWTSSGGGKWETGANWSLGIPPNINHNVVIANGSSGPPTFGSVLVDSTSATLPNNMVVSSLRVGRGSGIFFNNDGLNLFNAGATALTVLSSAVVTNLGFVTITGSTLDVRDGLYIRGGSVILSTGSTLSVKGNNYPTYDLGVNGSLTLNAGLLSFSNSFASGMAIGETGFGSLTMAGGTLHVAGSAFVDVGAKTGSVGTLTISGGMAKLQGQSFAVGAETNSTGSVLVTGGELITGDTYIGRRGAGRLTVSNGIWRANPANGVVLGQLAGSQGILTLAGGTSILSGTLSVGSSFLSSTGSLFVTGGELLITNHSVFVNDFAVVSNGVWRAKDVVAAHPIVFFGGSRLNFAGGTTMISSSLQIGAQFSCNQTGLVTVTAGSLIVTNAATNAMLAIYAGVFRLESGTVIVDKIDLTAPCARFERTGGTLIYKTALLDPARDNDGDGPSNALEQSTGFDPLDPADKWRDTDGDGATDADELMAGTDPRNSNSVVKIILILPQDEDVRLRWKTVGGRTNVIQAADSLANGSNNFEDLATIVIQGTGDKTNTFIEPEGATKGPSRYYRVKVIP